jgi:hypothetical protein
MEFYVSLFSVLLSAFALAFSVHRTATRVREARVETLRRVCATALGYAAGKDDVLAHAIAAGKVIDSEDGVRDFSDAEIRIGVEAIIEERRAQSTQPAAPTQTG